MSMKINHLLASCEISRAINLYCTIEADEVMTDEVQIGILHKSHLQKVSDILM